MANLYFLFFEYILKIVMVIVIMNQIQYITVKIMALKELHDSYDGYHDSIV